VTAKLRERDVKTLIGLLTLEIDRLGEAKEKCGCGDPSYFYHLIDIRNRLLTFPSDAEPPPHLQDCHAPLAMTKAGQRLKTGVNSSHNM